MANKTFQIDANILSNKKKTTKSRNTKKPKKKNNFFLIGSIFSLLIVIGLIFWIKNLNDNLIKDFLNGKIIVCKDRLVSKELGYIFNKNENAFINKKEGLFFTIYYCSRFDN
ncbi:MAG: hypothetical protein PHY66_09655 [Aliarcobacter sp.]|nr:hypothetical protein [Aliarcobacter sp.]